MIATLMSPRASRARVISLFNRSILLFCVLCLIAPALDVASPPAILAQESPGSAAPAAVDQPPEPAETALFSDDFEAYGDSTLWSNAFPFPVQSDVVAGGQFAARLINSGGNPVFGRTAIPEGRDRVFARLRFQVAQLDSISTTLLNLRSSSTSSVIAFSVNASGELSYLTGATGITSVSAIAAEQGIWHELQVLVDITSERENVRVWLDMTELTSMRQQVFLGDRLIRMVDLGDNSAGQLSNILFDDIIVDDEFISTTRQADPVPGVLVVNTFPAWGNIPFELDGRTYFSGLDGIAEIPVARWSTDLRSRIIVHDSYRPDGSMATFAGWKNWYSVHSRLVYAAFQINEPVTISFVDAEGSPVDPSLIDSMTIKSSSGVIQTFSGTDLSRPVLITTLSAALGPSGLETRISRYVVDEVNIGGSNAVHRAQQRSDFETTRHWVIPLLFYSVTFVARDAFFGTALGQEIVIQSLDGSERRFPLDENGYAVIPRLSRGEYSVVVIGAGYSPPRPIYVSRDQIIEMKVVSPLDIGTLLFVIGTVVIGLLVIGRPFLVTIPLRAMARGAASFRELAVREARLLPRERRR